MVDTSATHTIPCAAPCPLTIRHVRLKRLETFGFKSFADRMTFDFEDGITAVIGPNGCGKSNIVDSIKWVIGEQSAKALRGEDMTDVIFNGCATRRPMSLCEVTLVLDQIQGRINLDVDEVAITRRLFRDGTSGYYLNGKACRLRDIKELFMDTGVGTSAYSVIEQGRIGFILESNTKERRAILEEAAGISRYKSRRKVALRKLERVELDLQRIGEVLNEVKRRVKAVQRQAAAALRFRDLSALVKELRLAFALEEHGRLSGELATLATRGDDLNAKAAEMAARMGELDAAIAEAETRLVTLEARIRSQEEARAAAQSRRDVAEARARDARSGIQELAKQEVEDRQVLEGIGPKLAALAAERDAAEQAVLAIPVDGADESQNAEMTARRAELDALLAEVDGILHGVEDLKAKQVECMRELARVEAEQGRLEGSRNASAERRRRLEERTGGQTDQLAQCRMAEAAAQGQVERLMQEAAENHIKLDGLIRARETAAAAASTAEQQMNDLRHQEARAETGMRLLQEQERRAEGVGRGVREVLNQLDKLPGIIGMVADLCRIDDEHVTAIETALGGAAQNLITETQESARDAINFLKNQRSGRATFLPLDDILGGERVPHEALREPGVVGIASRLIEFEPRLRPAFEFLLGNVLVVETLDHGIAIRRRNYRTSCRMVSLDGEVISPGGAMTGGRQGGGHEGGGLVSRKAEIAKLSDTLADLTAKSAAAIQTRDRAKQQAFALGVQVEEARRAIQLTDRAVGEAKSQLVKAERDRSHLESATSSFGQELSEIAGDLGRLEAEGKELAGQHAWFTDLEAKLAAEQAAEQAKLEARAAARDKAQEVVNALRVSLATSQERREAARNHLGHLTRALQQQEDAQAERTRRLASLDSRRAELEALAESSDLAYGDCVVEVVGAARALEALVKERDQLRNRFEADRQEARSLAGKSRQLDNEKNQCALKAAESQVRLDTVAARVLEEYQVVLAEAFANYVRPENLDLDDVKARLATAEKELSAIGTVNLAAIDELDEVTAREEFLDKQFNDLNHAAERLKEIIEHINTISRKLFETTYRDVRKHFQELFRRLFGGGRADLEMEKTDENGNPVDMLEAGMEIIAQPPGKNPKIITQLSGGEKALTAIALLFAVYQTKSSPFCILDEVDAPLDDANVDVYNNMLKAFIRDPKDPSKPGSQFIVITHRKRSMIHADAIYGITQNEPGVSTKISVRVGDVESAPDNGELLPAITRGAGPFAG